MYEAELHGRKAVDCTLNLALAGVSDAWLYDELASHAEAEITRWGRRKSCSSMGLCQLAERAAAAGCEAPLGLFATIGAILVERGEPTFANTAAALGGGCASVAAACMASSSTTVWSVLAARRSEPIVPFNGFRSSWNITA